MHMWKNALEHVWNTRTIEHTQKLIDRMLKVMEAIIEVEGGEKFRLTIEVFVNFKSCVLLRFWPKVYHRKSAFFEMTKK